MTQSTDRVSESAKELVRTILDSISELHTKISSVAAINTVWPICYKIAQRTFSL